LDNKFFKQLALIMFATFVISVGGLSYLFEYLPKQLEATQKSAQLAAVLATATTQLHLDDPTKTTDCQIQGSLPDHGCSPGAIFETATEEVVCVAGYTKTVRSVSVKTRKAVFAEYGIEYPQPYGSYEVDHIIPLALGGSNDIANLFPEARVPFDSAQGKPLPGFQEKDVVENYLHEHVCSGEVDLVAAQVQIANNWLGVYNNLSEETIKAYKAKYKSWAPQP
jgi:5-methylcytosine-specific restriction endonuclease McrA